MKEPYGEGVANHTGLESCTVICEGSREALTEVSTGRVIELRKKPNSGCRRCADCRKATSIVTLARVKMEPCVVEEPLHVPKLHTRETGDPVSDLMRWCKVRMENPTGERP